MSTFEFEVFAHTSDCYQLRLSVDGEPHVDVVELSVPAVAAQSHYQFRCLGPAAPDGH
ncbi:hypothetical protein [Micromonospora carbonacea]|uniref:Uncharacterized protein n=1 Tax=Micromonospora carbonacea TaxID=47853 RepID=A0A7H8XSU3_9ACTN|nr:hypothetical protein [Micromonospora carbonacea]MBB5829967.1 hypothetical protein [Micromonospora carbonacea]QLD28086.1 hypothetical protein HXZ27_30980 [Micromonospora carbonacea]